MVPQEHGWFYGHFHGHTLCLRGLLEYAIVTNNAKLKNLVRDGYQYARTFGIARLGWFQEYTGKASHETCGLANMTALAVKLSTSGVGDYWEDVDCYVRNHLSEAQYLDMASAHKANRNLTSEQSEIIDRLQGAFSGWGAPNHLATIIMNCCMANGSQALYYAWDNIVQWDGKDSATIHLLLNRVSPVLTVDSYLPYKGKVTIINKKAKYISVRIPNWVDKSMVKANINGKKADFNWVGNYISIDSIKPKQRIEIEFPMVICTENHLVRSYEPRGTKLLDETQYTIRFKGNTAIDIAPKAQNAMYPTYQREYYLKEEPPMKEPSTYVPAKTIKW